jgi:hypothetical protein
MSRPTPTDKTTKTTKTYQHCTHRLKGRGLFCRNKLAPLPLQEKISHAPLASSNMMASTSMQSRRPHATRSIPSNMPNSQGTHPTFTSPFDEVPPRQCPCLRAFDSWCDQGIRQTRWRSDDTGKHGFYPGSPPCWVITYVLLV